MAIVNWNDAPKDAVAFGYVGAAGKPVFVFNNGYQYAVSGERFKFGKGVAFREDEITIESVRPTISLTSTEWPENEERITAIAQNGNTGEHYGETPKFIYTSNSVELVKPTEPKTAVEFLNACAAVQSERGKQYDASGTGERSFAAAASAFNAATGKSLTGSDVCLLLTMVKLVRQYSSPDRLHHDSLLDGVSYLSLWAEELSKELGET